MVAKSCCIFLSAKVAVGFRILGLGSARNSDQWADRKCRWAGGYSGTCPAANSVHAGRTSKSQRSLDNRASRRRRGGFDYTGEFRR